MHVCIPDMKLLGKKHKYKSLSMLDKVKLQNKLEKGMSVKTVCEYYASDHQLCMT